ncbi:unnamed protein product [Leptidea sinapis]|uniref:Histone H2A/H2B/H3 domain-containing protein n=1 Tax=Leptidea sinapis TaxID=189913 RepID=A0A5E4QY19_9NEOP|nr:unnamed protein product [Leptidea sinapis]
MTFEPFRRLLFASFLLDVKVERSFRKVFLEICKTDIVRAVRQQRSPAKRRRTYPRLIRKKEVQEEEKLRNQHLQSAQAGAPGHRYLVEGHVDHKLFRERHLRTYRGRGVTSCALQREVQTSVRLLLPGELVKHAMRYVIPAFSVEYLTNELQFGKKHSLWGRQVR